MSERIIEPKFLLQAYANGIFPMALEDGEIGWFSPDPRAIIPLDDDFHVPHGLRKFLRKSPYEIRVNTAFHEVIEGCSRRKTTWIDATVKSSYCLLHEMGHAHSVETWHGDDLVGGLYGVSIGGAFFGESMFSRESNASSSALVALVQRMRQRGFLLLDTQWTTPHLLRFGTQEIPRSLYFNRLKRAQAVRTSFVD